MRYVLQYLYLFDKLDLSWFGARPGLTPWSSASCQLPLKSDRDMRVQRNSKLTMTTTSVSSRAHHSIVTWQSDTSVAATSARIVTRAGCHALITTQIQTSTSYIHTCRSYVHTPRDIDRHSITQALPTLNFTSGWVGWPIRLSLASEGAKFPQWQIPCPGRPWTTLQNLTPLALSWPEKSVTVQTKTVNNISTPSLSACVDIGMGRVPLMTSLCYRWEMSSSTFCKYRKGVSEYKGWLGSIKVFEIGIVR